MACAATALLLVLPAGRLDAQITLVQCYEAARNNYPLVKQYGLIDQTEGYNLSNAAKGWLPQLAVNARASLQSDVTTMPFDADRMAAVIPGFSIKTMSKDQYQLTAELSQAIWDGGTIAAVKNMASAQAKAERAGIASELYALNGRVNGLYFGRLLQDELLKQNAILQSELLTNIEKVTAMIANGVANESDRESLRVELLNAQRAAIELQASRKAYVSMLASLTGLSIGDETALALPKLPGLPLSTDIMRPELAALDAQDVLISSQNKRIHAGTMPRLGLFVQGGYGRPGLNMLSNTFEPFYIAGIRLSWNIGSFYTLKNDLHKTEASRRTVDVQRQTFLFNTGLQLLQQKTEVMKMEELIRADREILDLRASIKKAAEAKLANGVISVTDLIREINAEDLARQTAATHRIMQLIAVYNYMYAQGQQTDSYNR
ncbi:MAG: TolC family protein [Tannerellaceae bacterium]|nr:TolC family protein [Tannerellaceae bacterium]